MRVAIIGGKPSLALPFARVVEDRFLAARQSPFVTVFANPGRHLNYSFAYPRGLSWGDYPFVGEPSYKPMSLTNWLPPHLSLPERINGWGSVPKGYAPSEDEVVSRIRKADVIIAAMDGTHAGVLTLRRVLDYVFPEGAPEDRIIYPFPTCSDEREVRRSLNEARPLSWVEDRFLPYAKARRRFDYCFNTNAFAILRRTMTAAGIAPETPVPTKYGIQLLYGLRSAKPMSDGQIIELMSKWKGTGKYERPRYAWTKFGSAMSRAWIVHGLIKAELLEWLPDDSGRIRLSDAGARFLSLLHPDCEDPDMHFRLDAWCHLPLEESYPKIERYIRTFFGKQKRFLSRHLPEATLS